MNLYPFLKLYDPALASPEQFKIHLAVYNGYQNPLDVYLAGDFEEWQSHQTKRNFERTHALALISMPQPDRWLFVGVYSTNGYQEIIKWDRQIFKYDTQLIETFTELEGRLIVHFKRSGRASYLNGERWIPEMSIAELKDQRMVVSDFDSFKTTCIGKAKLNIIIQKQIPSWKSALNNVSGIYLITDTSNGKLYVGSATGEGGIWGRWCAYAQNGHGGNKELRQLLKEQGDAHAQHFQYTILETADTHAKPEDVLERESYWKKVLGSREWGYNGN